MPTHFSRYDTPIPKPPSRVRSRNGRSRGCEPRSDSQRSRDTDDALSKGPQRAWRLGIVRDRTGHVHVGAVLSTEGWPLYVDLLAAVGAASPEQLDLDDMHILVHGDEIEHLRHLAERCIEDERLRTRLIELANASSASLPGHRWTA
jgi:hypothetical protein